MAKKTSIADLVASINKAIGPKATDQVAVYSDIQEDEQASNAELVSCGSSAIDYIVGGGFPVHRVTEVHGEYSSGKSLLCHEIIANVMDRGGWGQLFDTEAAYDDRFGSRIGIDPKRLLYSRPDTVEDLFDMLEATLIQFREKMPDALLCSVWDSLAASSTRHEMAEPEKVDYSKAKVIGAGMRRITRLLAKQKAMFIVVNQVRDKVGVMFGSSETVPGGRAVPFHASLRVRLRQGSMYRGHPVKILDDGVVIGSRIVAECVKNKLAPPFKRAEVITSFEHGFVKHSGLAYLLRDEGRLTSEEPKRKKGEKEQTPEEKKKSSGKEVFSYGGERFRWWEIDQVVEKHPELLRIGNAPEEA